MEPKTTCPGCGLNYRGRIPISLSLMLTRRKVPKKALAMETSRQERGMCASFGGETEGVRGEEPNEFGGAGKS